MYLQEMHYQTLIAFLRQTNSKTRNRYFLREKIITLTSKVLVPQNVLLLLRSDFLKVGAFFLWI